MKGVLDRIADPSCFVRIIDPIKDRAKQIQDILASKGYSRVTLNDDIASFEDDVSKKEVNWLICHHHEDNHEEFSHMLKRIHHQRCKTRVLALCHKSNPSMYRLYELGIIGHILRNTKIQEQFDHFLKKCKQYATTNLLEIGLSAFYLRKIFEELEDWQKLIDLERRLSKIYSKQISTHIVLAEAYCKAGDTDNARLITAQLKQINSPKYAASIEKLTKKFPQLNTPGTNFPDIFNIDKVLVIEADDSEFVRIESSLNAISIPEVVRYTDFETAWTALSRGLKPNIVIFEWSNKTKGLTCDQFIQRYRINISRTTPLIALDSNIPDRDNQIIHDMRTTAISRKPVREENFVMAVTYAVEQYYQPTEAQSIERRIEQLLIEGDSAYVQFLKHKFINDPNVDKKRKFYIEGFYQYCLKEYKKAKKFLTKGLTLPNKNANYIQNIDKKNILAHCFDRLGDKVAAIKLLSLTIRISPKNIELHCFQSSLLYEVGEKKSAIKSLENALALDSKNPMVIGLKAKISILEKGEESLQNLLSQSPNSLRIIERLNIHANRYQIKGEFDISLKIYEWLIQFIPDKLEDTLGIIYYNQALALIRCNRFNRAMGALYSASEYEATPTAKKAKLLRIKIEKIHESNQPIDHIFEEMLPPTTETNISVTNDYVQFGLYSVYAWEPNPVKIDLVD